ncbi:FAD-dependent oxidoreductase [Streptomyces spiramenti]|uniref:NAD(P)/FAD-dependent oxidoreductase n=1 Tax=Streptomyces spiramenti TaxID=2720606 RepID=A0ABX1AFV7_9ACTN|nr:FAD-dependent oxidoreductase [Streptomyces spiramenti]NJP64774.1 NAD(P)/FAD-dependent oxidoreductase [Streptomyces spiramenti]
MDTDTGTAQVIDSEVVVVGAGQAGLSTAHHLARRGYAPGSELVVLDGSPAPGGAWQHRWPTLTYGQVHGIHALPGMELTGADPQRPSSAVLGEYFSDYEDRFDLRVRRPVRVHGVRDDGAGRLLVQSDHGTWRTRALVNATGTWESPFWPNAAGRAAFRGRQLHTADYRGPEAMADARVVVVGGGTSAVQHLLEIAARARATTWVTRRPPVFRSTDFDPEEGRRAVALVDRRVRAGLPPRSVVSVTGLPMNEAVRRGRQDGTLDRLPMFDRITPDGVTWADGRFVPADVLLWATGFRPVVRHLAPLGLREPGGGISIDGTRAVRDARVHLVGYGPSASTIGANRAGRTAAREIDALLGGRAPGRTTAPTRRPVAA